MGGFAKTHSIQLKKCFKYMQKMYGKIDAGRLKVNALGRIHT